MKNKKLIKAIEEAFEVFSGLITDNSKTISEYIKAQHDRYVGLTKAVNEVNNKLIFLDAANQELQKHKALILKMDEDAINKAAIKLMNESKSVGCFCPSCGEESLIIKKINPKSTETTIVIAG